MVRGNKNIVISCDPSYKNWIFNNFLGMQDMAYMNVLVICGYLCVSSVVNWNSMATSNNNFLIWINKRRIIREITLWCFRVRCYANIHVPLIFRSMERHGVHSGPNVCRFLRWCSSYICLRILSYNAWLLWRTGRECPLIGGIHAQRHNHWWQSLTPCFQDD